MNVDQNSNFHVTINTTQMINQNKDEKETADNKPKVKDVDNKVQLSLQRLVTYCSFYCYIHICVIKNYTRCIATKF